MFALAGQVGLGSPVAYRPCHDCTLEEDIITGGKFDKVYIFEFFYVSYMSIFLPLSIVGEEMQAFSPVWRTCSSTQSQKDKRRFLLINFSQ